MELYRTLMYFTFVVIPAISVATELTFELPDNAKQCFYQDIDKDTSAVLEYQVISGGRHDVDCKVEDPDGLELYNERKQQYGSHQWNTMKKGVYKVCFSNEFSTITHKVVYFEWQYGAEAPLLPEMAKATALTQMETSIVGIHEQVNKVIDYQTKFRLREATGRLFAVTLGERVQIWSFLQMLILFVVAIGQIVILRSLFSDKQNRSRSAT